MALPTQKKREVQKAENITINKQTNKRKCKWEIKMKTKRNKTYKNIRFYLRQNNHVGLAEQLRICVVYNKVILYFFFY